MSITCFNDFVDIAKKSKRKTIMAVVEAQDEHTLESIIEAANSEIMIPKLIGNEKEIKSLLTSFNSNPAKYEIISTGGVEESLDTAVRMIKTGDATALMKGKLESADYIKALVKKENRLLDEGSQLSVTGFFSPPAYHKLIAVSDPALNMYPDLTVKKAIITNAVKMFSALGYETPKVAIMASIEKLNPKMPETVDADALKKMNQNGEIIDCVIEGPISFDLAISAEAARIKGYESLVAGDADLLVVPDITAGNLLVKCLTILAGAQTAGCVLGARVPAVLVSRSAEATDKYYSIALAACIGGVL